jgi:hypothetical protein
MDVFIDESGTHKHIGHATTAIVYIEVISIDKFEENLNVIEQKFPLLRLYHRGLPRNLD